MMRDPKTDPIPAPDPATPTVAAPAPMNLAAEVLRRLVACTVAAGLTLLQAAMPRRGETDRRAIADMVVLELWSGRKSEEVGGLQGGWPHAPPGGHAEASHP